MVRMLMIGCCVASTRRHAHAGHGHVPIARDGFRFDLEPGQALQCRAWHFT
ncbi:hypothetical protein [Acetobacter persici]|uniref:hypothetical protein n=1 Tax=Acetobacter persici TaxID=1076596 RepID=UPI001BAD3807|nr:hypothetical protein [Acetobacter persici]MBS0963706.1 hypothetical protein [Acetobacter persici]MCG0999331.1 hypothetical protein [Acetobacter persici]